MALLELPRDTILRRSRSLKPIVALRFRSKPIVGATHPIVLRLFNIRMAWQLSRQDVAKRIGCTVLTLRRYENGLAAPSFKFIVKWAYVLGYDISIWPRSK